jgi:hypothetical protein
MLACHARALFVRPGTPCCKLLQSCRQATSWTEHNSPATKPKGTQQGAAAPLSHPWHNMSHHNVTGLATDRGWMGPAAGACRAASSRSL